MSIIRGAMTDATFDRVYQYDRQFRLRVSQQHTKSWANIDVFLWLQFIANGAQGVTIEISKPCFDFNLKGICYRQNCIYKHSCMKCSAFHPALTCYRFIRVNGHQNRFNRPRFNNQAVRYQNGQPSTVRPVLRSRGPVPRFSIPYQ